MMRKTKAAQESGGDAASAGNKREQVSKHMTPAGFGGKSGNDGQAHRS